MFKIIVSDWSTDFEHNIIRNVIVSDSYFEESNANTAYQRMIDQIKAEYNSNGTYYFLFQGSNSTKFDIGYSGKIVDFISIDTDCYEDWG